MTNEMVANDTWMDWNYNSDIEKSFSEMIDLSESAEKLLEPCWSPRPPHIWLVKETAGQHCLVVNLAWITFSHIMVNYQQGHGFLLNKWNKGFCDTVTP